MTMFRALLIAMVCLCLCMWLCCRTPKYLLEASGDGEEFVIIRFAAGPPYEDLAFKVRSSVRPGHCPARTLLHCLPALFCIAYMLVSSYPAWVMLPCLRLIS
jgi:hypothetical protein